VKTFIQHTVLLVVLLIVQTGICDPTFTAPSLPTDSQDKHLGNATCGSAFCHDAAQPWKTSAVMQNEFSQWKAHDPHAKAYNTLTSDAAKKIANNLNIATPEQEKRCLDCHANNVSVEKRGRQFSITDGVSCEACHGGADRWLGVHVSGTGDHAQNIASGMYPTDKPQARAALCASCHVGNANKFVDHQMISSGHPRLAFELNTYTATGASHFHISDEYKKRKGIPDDMQSWAIGQAETARLLMNGIADQTRFNKGSNPELAFFDCYACHHSMSTQQWLARPELSNLTGVPRLNDANLQMLQLIAQRIDPSLAQRLQKERMALHAATLQNFDSTRQAALALSNTTTTLATRFAEHRFQAKDMLLLAQDIVSNIHQVDINDYLTAEQITLTLSSMIAGLHDSHSITDKQYQHVERTMDAVYKTVEHAETFQPAQFHQAMLPVQKAIQSLQLPE
jgi:hypothetical protein